MSSVRYRRNRKIRRAGQHTAPSQAARVAQKAGKAAPAIAVAGALTVAPPVHKPAPRGPADHVQVIHPDTHLAARTYTVQAGDTLSRIAQRFYGQPVAWPWLYRVNRAEITDPGLISAGQVLDVPADLRGSFTAHRVPAGAPAYRPRHAAAPAAAPPPLPVPARLGGILGYAALERLWVAEGGNPADEASPPASPSTSPAVIRAQSPPPATTACGRSMTIRLPLTRPPALRPRSRCLRTGQTGQRGLPSPTADFPAAARRSARLSAKITRHNLRAPGRQTWSYPAAVPLTGRQRIGASGRGHGLLPGSTSSRRPRAAAGKKCRPGTLPPNPGRFRTRRGYCDLRLGRMSWLRQDRGSWPSICSTWHARS